MKNFLKRIGISGKLYGNFGAIVILAVGVAVITGLPFFRFEYYDVYLKTYHLTNTQMGLFGTIIGITGMFSYLFGGIIADGLPVKKIIVISLIATGVGGFLHLLPIGFRGLLLIYLLWGISTTFAFWPACVKAVRAMSDKDSQGKAYGFFEGTKNIFAGIIALIAVLLFKLGTSGMSNKLLAMKYVILFYSSANILMALFAHFAVKDDRLKLDADRVTFQGVGKLLKSPAIWIIAMISFCNHIFCLSVYYYIPYTTNILKASVAFGAMMGVFRKFGSIGGNIVGGYLTDRIGTSKVMLISYVAVLLSQWILFIVPAKNSFVPIVTILFVLILVFFNMNFAMTWTMISEGDIPLEYSGTAAGLISTAGAIPEIFVSVLAGKIIDNNPGEMGYRYFFNFLTVMIGVALVFILIWEHHIKKKKIEKQKLDEKDRDKIKVCMHN